MNLPFKLVADPAVPEGFAVIEDAKGWVVVNLEKPSAYRIERPSMPELEIAWGTKDVDRMVLRWSLFRLGLVSL